MLSLFGKYLKKRERARERLNWQHSKMDRASIADISLPVHAVQATSSYAESPSTSAEWIARAAIILIASGIAWYTWGIGEIFKSTTDASFTFPSPLSTENFSIVISGTCTALGAVPTLLTR
jgi:hypothetical protein